jgi:hypothetical protein
MLSPALMSEVIGPDDAETTGKSKFELGLAKAHLRMENVSERVQLAVVHGLTAIGISAIAVYALKLVLSPPANEESNQDDT